MGKGEIISSFTKKKVNLLRSIESKLTGMDNTISKVLWMKCFLEWQGLPVKLNIIYQDNTSSINPGDGGKESSV